jgi:adenylate cyclase
MVRVKRIRVRAPGRRANPSIGGSGTGARMSFRGLLNGVLACSIAGKASTVSVTNISDTTGGLPDPRRLIAVVYADMVGYSRLIGLDDLQTLERLRKLRNSVIDPALGGHGGRIVQTGGDSLLMVFNSIDGAVRFAVKVQQDVPVFDGDQPHDRAIRFRIGINIGDAIADGTDLHGDAVNVAVRIQAECPPGGICVSRAVRDHVHGRLDLVFEELGPLHLKNIARPVEAFVLKLDGVKSVAAPDRANSATTLATASRRRRKRWALVAVAGTTAFVAAGFVVWARHAGKGPDLFGLGSRPVEVATLATPARLAGRPSVAVLPFKNLSGDTAQDFFSDGITEDVITALGRFSNLLVISKSASFPFRGSNSSPAEIGRLLDARYLLEGSIRRAGNRVRVGVELTEAKAGRLVWSETYDAEADDIFAVQDKIARRVVGAAAVELTRFEQERALAKPTSNLAAYEYVLRGREAFSHETRDDNDEASELFQRAIDLDPNYADAYAALAGSYQEAVVSGWSEFRAEELERAEALAQKALALDPATTRAYRVLSQINLYRKRYDLSLAQTDRALEINPSDANNYAERGSTLVWAGRATEALPWLEGALRFDRANGFAAARLCTVYYLLRRYTEAVDVCDRALSRNPGRNTQMITHPMLAATYAELGRQQDADGERAIATHLWPLLDARTFAAQFGTQEAQDHMLEGLKKAGFH